MVVFQVSSRGVQRPEPTRKRARRFPAEWYVVARVVGSGFIGGAFFTLLVQFGHSTVFIVLPVLASLSWAQPQRYNISTFLTSTPIYLLLTSCLAFLYYGALTEGQLLLYQRPGFALIIPSPARSPARSSLTRCASTSSRALRDASTCVTGRRRKG